MKIYDICVTMLDIFVGFYLCGFAMSLDSTKSNTLDLADVTIDIHYSIDNHIPSVFFVAYHYRKYSWMRINTKFISFALNLISKCHEISVI